MILVIGKILAALLFPPGIFIVVIALAVLLAIKGRRKLSIYLLVGVLLLLYLSSTNLVASLLLKPLENSYPPIAGPGDAKAIVVLGGGYVESSPEYGGVGALSSDSEKRAIYGLELSRRYGLPLVFTGGAGLRHEAARHRGRGGGQALAGPRTAP